MSHTPGPWAIQEYGDEDAPALVIHKDSETRICSSEHDHRRRHHRS